MYIKFDSEKKETLDNLILSHDFKEYLGFTNRYKGFEILNLDNQVKLSLLKKLSIENWRDPLPFEKFWIWFKKNHGMKVAQQFATFMFPTDEKNANYWVNSMRNNTKNELWQHIKSRVYKKWCSIITEMQSTYSLLEGIESNSLDWKVMSTAELDSCGIDFLIIKKDSVIPVQVKKDSFRTNISHKQNNSENLSRYKLTKKQITLIKTTLIKEQVDFLPIEKMLLLKYGLADRGNLPYDYLSQHNNGFIYFDSNKLVNTLKTHIENEKDCIFYENTPIVKKSRSKK